MSPTQRSKKLLESQGYFVAIVEHWNQFAHIRQDLFGIFDLLAIRGNETLGVQTTSGANVSARVEKMRSRPVLALWLAGSMRGAKVHGWRKVGARGNRKIWECREVELRDEPLPPQTAVELTGEALTGTISPHP